MIKECEDYVKTEEFTKDLGSQILKMFMQERSTALSEELMKNSESRDSLYENHYEDHLFRTKNGTYGTKNGTCDTNGTNGTNHGINGTSNSNKFYMDHEDFADTIYGTQNGIDSHDTSNNTKNGTHENGTNGTKYGTNYQMDHEESPESNDSAYDSEYRKKDLIFPGNHHNYFIPTSLSKSSSLVMMNLDCDSNLDNVSNASTIKNQHFRDESISYDTVLR